MSDKLVDELEALEGFDLAFIESGGTGRPSDNVGGGIVADPLFADRAANSVLTESLFNFSRSGLSYTVTASNVSSAKGGDYKAVVVLNSSLSSGTDPTLDKFIKAYPAKNQIFLVNLYSGRTSTAVDTFTAAKSPEGVDGVTAASTWRDAIEIHIAWMNDLVTFLKKA